MSIHKKLDYSAPVVFVPFGTQTTTKVAPKKQITPQNNKPKTVSAPSPPKPTEVKKPITVATPAKKPDLPKATLNTSIAVNDVKKVEKIEQKKEVMKTELPKETNKQEKKPENKEQKITSVIPENAQISHNYREVEALRIQAQLQKEIVQTWKPPIGVSPDCTCDVSFFVTTTGTLNHIKMVKSSGVMMFDISARQALCATKMPHWTYGKTLTITFKQ